MLEIIVDFLLAVFIFISAFYIICFLVRLWTGCSTNEAVKKVHNFISGKGQYHFESDAGFVDEIWRNVKNIIGEKRFQQLINLSYTAINPPLLVCGEKNGLPYVALSIYYESETEKRILESVIGNVFIRYLQMAAYDTQILKEWTTRYDLDMLVLEIRYARTEEEKRILGILLQHKQNEITTGNSAITDDTETEELDG